MPRPGAVTRSMTRAGIATLHSACEQASTRGIVAEELRPEHITASVHENTLYEWPKSKLSASSSQVADSIPSSGFLDEILIQNRLTIIRLEQYGILTPGIITVKPSGELCANISVEPDMGMMASLYPNLPPPPDADEQIPSWLRDYLLKILNVHGYGPPAVCRAFYDHLIASEGDKGINHSVRTAESHLSYATISLRYAIEVVKSFMRTQHIFYDTYEEEIRNVIKIVKRLVGYEGESMAKDISMLLDIAQMGTSLRGALIEPFNRLIVHPYTQLLEQLELVSKALRMQLDHFDQETEKARESEGPRFTPDSGIHGC